MNLMQINFTKQDLNKPHTYLPGTPFFKQEFESRVSHVFHSRSTHFALISYMRRES